MYMHLFINHISQFTIISKFQSGHTDCVTLHSKLQLSPVSHNVKSLLWNILKMVLFNFLLD